MGRALLSSEKFQNDELRYVYQRIGFQCLSETRFEEAGELLLIGELDPRVLVSFFPELRGNLFGPNDSVDMFSGVAERMPSESSVEDISKYRVFDSSTRPHECSFADFVC